MSTVLAAPQVVITTRFFTAVFTPPEDATPAEIEAVTGPIRDLDDTHAAIGRALTAQGRDHTDLGWGFMVPSFTPFAMSDHETARWLADLGIDMGKCTCCGRVFCVRTARTGW